MAKYSLFSMPGYLTTVYVVEMVSALKINDTGATSEKICNRCILFVRPWDAMIMRVDNSSHTQ